VDSRVTACLNGARTRGDHAGVPLTAAELAADAVAVKGAGASGVHVHPRDAAGRETLERRACDAAVAAIRKAAPTLEIGMSVAEAIERDPFARTTAIKAWRSPPDLVSVNVWELGWAGIVRATLHAGIGVETALGCVQDAQELAASAFVHRITRAVVVGDAGIEAVRAIAACVPPGVAQLWHAHDAHAWEILIAGVGAGRGVRIGLEDVLTGPDGAPVSGNAELVAAAVAAGGA
jgi:uncharacterized protein (DUF849 family)